MTYRNFPSWLILMGLVTALGPLAIDMYLPAFVAIADDLNTSTNTIELSLASYFIGIAIGQAFYGPLSDRFGRKPPLVFGLVLYTLAALACALVPEASWLVAVRFLQAFGGCAGMVIARAVVRDKTSPQDSAKAFSMLILVLGVAPILAPLFGTWVLSVSSWRGIFVFQAISGLACLLWVMFWLKETHSGDSRKLSFGQVFRDFAVLTRNRQFMGFSLTTAFAMSGFFAYLGSSPALLMGSYGLTPDQYALVFGANAAGFIALSQCNTFLLRHFSMLTVVRAVIWVQPVVGLCLMVVSVAWLTPPLWLLLTLLWVFITSIGLINPNASACALTLPGLRVGTASSLLGVMQFSLATVVAFGIGALPQTTAIPLGWSMAGMAMLSFYMLYGVAVPAQRQSAVAEK